MIEKIEVRNWQSLRSVDLDLGRFTVIVGASSSGKTALMRALRAVASNVRGAGHITRGQKITAITVRTGDHIVTLERSEANGRYRVVGPGGAEQVFTKLAGSVPEQVTAALRIDPVPTSGTSINFAGQFDRPFLLDDSGANVARALGELTNVTTIFEAVAEANRRRKSSAATLKTRQNDLAELSQRATEYADLPTKLAALSRAEQTAEQATALRDRTMRLRELTSRLEIAEQVLARSDTLPELPTMDRVDRATGRLAHFRDLVRQLLAAERDAATYANAVEHNVDEESRWESELTDLLRAAGRCPTCGQPVH